MGGSESVGEAGVPQWPVEVLPALPNLSALYAQSAATSSLAAAKRVLPGRWAEVRTLLPRVIYRVARVETDRMASELRDFQRLLHETSSSDLTSAFLQTLATPVAKAIVARSEVPVKLLTLLHIGNSAALYCPVQLGDVLEVSAWLADLRPHPMGVALDLAAEIRRVGDPDRIAPVWRGRSTYISRSLDLSEEADPQPPVVWTPPLPTGRWVLPNGTARAYAAITGERNPVYLSNLAARAAGLPRAILQGMYSAGRALADAGAARGDAYRWTVSIKRPVTLPTTIDIAVTPTPSGFDYVGWSSARRIRHFTGTVEPLLTD